VGCGWPRSTNPRKNDSENAREQRDSLEVHNEPPSAEQFNSSVVASGPVGTVRYLQKKHNLSGGLSFEELQREQHAVDADADFEFAAERFDCVAQSAK
jgi:hypothetical protein